MEVVGEVGEVAQKQRLIYRRDGTVPHVGGVECVSGRGLSMVVAIGGLRQVEVCGNRFFAQIYFLSKIQIISKLSSVKDSTHFKFYYRLYNAAPAKFDIALHDIIE